MESGANARMTERRGLTSLRPRTPDPATLQRVSDREAAERLGTVYRYLAVYDGLPLDSWAIPLKREQFHNALNAVLLDVYGSESQRQQRYGTGSNYRSAYSLYKDDYDQLIPKIRREARAWTKNVLDGQEAGLRALLAKIQEQSGPKEELHNAAVKVGQLAGGYNDGRDIHEVNAQGKGNSARAVLEIYLARRRRFAPVVREQKNKVLATLFTHHQGVSILEAYAESSDAGRKLASNLVTEAINGIVEFRNKLNDRPEHFWRYPRLVLGGVNRLGLEGIPGVEPYWVSVGQVLGRNAPEGIVGFAGMALLCLAVFFTGPVALALIGAGDLALAGMATGLAYVREREQELGAEGSALMPEGERIATSTGYEDTALAGAAALLSAIVFFQAGRQLRELVKAKPKSIPESLTPKREPASKPPDAPTAHEATAVKGKNGTGDTLRENRATGSENQGVDRVGIHYHEFDPEELGDTQKPGFGAPSTEKGGTGYHAGKHFHEYSASEVAIGMRIDWDPNAARPRKITYNFTAEAAAVPSQATKRSMHQETRLMGESAQSRKAAYSRSGMDMGHGAQREAGKVDPAIDAALGLKPTGPEVERSLDVLTNIIPMNPNLNQGRLWRAAETRTAQFAVQEGYVTVDIIPIYERVPPTLGDKTPIPKQVRRVIRSGPTGTVLEDLTFDNK